MVLTLLEVKMDASLYLLFFICMWLMSVSSILFVAEALACNSDIEWLVILGVGPLLVRTVLAVSSFGTVSMGLFCRRILFTKAVWMLWQQLPVITGSSLLVLMVRYRMLVLFGVQNYISGLSLHNELDVWHLLLLKYWYLSKPNVFGITLLPDTSRWYVVASFE